MICHTEVPNAEILGGTSEASTSVGVSIAHLTPGRAGSAVHHPKHLHAASAQEPDDKNGDQDEEE